MATITVVYSLKTTCNNDDDDDDDNKVGDSVIQ